MSKVKFGIEFVSDGFMISKFFSIIWGQGMNLRREGSQKINDGVCDALGSFTFNLLNKSEAWFTLSQRDDSLLVMLANDGIKLPVANTGARIDDGGTFIDADPVNELASAAIAAIAFTSLLLAT